MKPKPCAIRRRHPDLLPCGLHRGRFAGYPVVVIEAWPPWGALSLLAVGALAGFLNVVAGGGSLLTMPLLILLGLPPGVANGTARLAIGVQNAAAVVRYQRAGQVDWALLRRLASPTLVGCAAGVFAAVQLGDAGFRALLGGVMLICAVLVLLQPEPAPDAVPPASAQHGWLRVWLVGLAIGFYGGLVQAGVGYLILFLLTTVLRQPLLSSNVLKVALVLVYTPLALVLFVSQGLFALVPACALALGQAAGGWIGARAAGRGGARFIRGVLLVVVVASAVELLRGGLARI